MPFSKVAPLSNFTSVRAYIEYLCTLSAPAFVTVSCSGEIKKKSMATSASCRDGWHFLNVAVVAFVYERHREVYCLVDALGRFPPPSSPHCATEYKQAVVQQWLSLLLFTWNAKNCSVYELLWNKSWNVALTNPMLGHCVVQSCIVSTFPAASSPSISRTMSVAPGRIRSSQTVCGFRAGHLIRGYKGRLQGSLRNGRFLYSLLSV